MFGLGKKEEKKSEEGSQNTKNTEEETKMSVEVSDGSETATADPVKEPIEVDAEKMEAAKNAKEEQEIPPITWKEMKALKRAKYDKIASKFNTEYTLLNKRTGQVVEIRAASSLHACNIIGWKSRKVKVLEVKEVESPNISTSQSDMVPEELPPGLQ